MLADGIQAIARECQGFRAQRREVPPVFGRLPQNPAYGAGFIIDVHDEVLARRDDQRVIARVVSSGVGVEPVDSRSHHQAGVITPIRHVAAHDGGKIPYLENAAGQAEFGDRAPTTSLRVELTQQAHLAGVDVVMEADIAGWKRHGYHGLRAIQLQPPHLGRKAIADDKSIVREDGGDTGLAAHAYPTNRTIGIDDDRRPEPGLHCEKIEAESAARRAALDEHRTIVGAFRVCVRSGSQGPRQWSAMSRH